MNEIYNFFLEAYSNSPTYIIVLEFIAFIFGIISVVYAKKENILVYPTGIICTVITIYLLYRALLSGDGGAGAGMGLRFQSLSRTQKKFLAGFIVDCNEKGGASL